MAVSRRRCIFERKERAAGLEWKTWIEAELVVALLSTLNLFTIKDAGIIEYGR